MGENQTLLIIFFSLLGGLFILFLIYLCIRSYWVQKVEETSELYQKVVNLNDKYENIFFNDINQKYKFHNTCSSKREFDKLSLRDFFQERLEQNLNFYENIFKKIEANNINYQRYLNDYDDIKVSTTQEKLKSLKIKVPYKTYIKFEMQLYYKNKLEPILSTESYISTSYTSPAGRNHYSKDMTCNFQNFKRMIVISKQAIEFRKTQEYQRKLERSKVTPSLRYDVIQRDNSICKLCNASKADGIMLHVDHIIPVSKGGKTELRNLQTLCSTCNLGKSDKYEEKFTAVPSQKTY